MGTGNAILGPKMTADTGGNRFLAGVKVDKAGDFTGLKLQVEAFLIR
jgi:hypothetical protein